MRHSHACLVQISGLVIFSYTKYKVMTTKKLLSLLTAYRNINLRCPDGITNWRRDDVTHTTYTPVDFVPARGCPRIVIKIVRSLLPSLIEKIFRHKWSRTDRYT